ncbi:MAG: site-2 protease family protein [Gemmatimonadetes bacterium]|nr:site-2 protease family protein [Gemmatimonadota bacterium]
MEAQSASDSHDLRPVPARPVTVRCPQCGTELAPGLLACPACHRLIQGVELKRLAADAERAAQTGDLATELAAWRQALDLLPADSRQYDAISTKVAALSRRLDTAGEPVKAAPRPAWAARAGVLGALVLLLWKFKFLLGFLVTKGKFLVLGLTKGGTLFSMLLSLGVYWRVFGWKWALGVIASIYIHEMGHVAMLRRFGIAATAPMFIPGVGAVIRSRYYPKDVIADARVGLAGPIWGLGAALAAYLVFLTTALPAWGALAAVGAWINLFNLLPVWQLDGAHGFRALTRRQRWMATAVIGAMWYLTAEGLLVLLLIGAAAAAWLGKAAEQPDRRALVEYALLVVILSVMTTIPVPVAALTSPR